MEGGIFVAIFLFLTIGCILGGLIISKHKERMRIIEKGLTPEDIKALYLTQMRPSSPLSSLKWGILFVMVGLAIFLGVWLDETFRENTHSGDRQKALRVHLGAFLLLSSQLLHFAVLFAGLTIAM